MVFDEMHSRVLREMPHVVVKPASSIFEKSYESGKVSRDRKNENSTQLLKTAKRMMLVTTDLST